MKTEYEIRILEIDVEKFIDEIKKLGAIKVGEWHQKRYVFDTKPKSESEWFRLRTNGEVTTLTYKNVEANTIDGTKELEIEVSNFYDTLSMMELLGYKHRAYQENKRLRYILDNVEIDIDSWPLIPTYLEIEGPSEEAVYNTLKELGFDKNAATTRDVEGIYLDYGHDLNQIYDLKLEEDRK